MPPRRTRASKEPVKKAEETVVEVIQVETEDAEKETEIGILPGRAREI